MTASEAEIFDALHRHVALEVELLAHDRLVALHLPEGRSASVSVGVGVGSASSAAAAARACVLEHTRGRCAHGVLWMRRTSQESSRVLNCLYTPE